MLGTRLTLVAVAAALAAAGCGDDDDKTADADGPRTATKTETTSTPAREQPPPEPDEAVGHETLPGAGGGGAGAPQAAPGRGCLRGSYVSLSFKGKRSVNSPFGAVDLSGRGRGLGLEFTGSRWTMRGVGRRPMRGKAFGIDGTLRVNGSARGRLIRVEGERLRFRQTGSRGTVELSGLDQTFELPVSVVAPAVVPDGRATVSCRGDRLTIDSASGVLRLQRP